MFKQIARAAIALAGASLGYGVFVLIGSLAAGGVVSMPQQMMDSVKSLTVMVFFILLTGLIFYLISPWIMERGLRIAQRAEVELEKVPTNQILVGTMGLIAGMVIAYLLGGLIRNMMGLNAFSSILSAIAYGFLGYLGVSISTRKVNDLARLPEIFKAKNTAAKAAQKQGQGAKCKILDTSVIIDGRIADICRTGFLEGTLVVPQFVLDELRHIADSSDSLKRNRGRRGLDILKLIQQEKTIEVKIVDTNFEDVAEVDMKLLKLAQKIDGMVMTNDYNLNKVAELQNIPILNINELANAVKPVVLPGEEMTVTLIKEGKESNQAVAYLDDGTMIVVENGRRYIGETQGVLVTSVLQTAAGRMIFAKPKAV